MYMDIAMRLSEESHAVRLKVGAVFVSEDGVMSSGINGMPADTTNVCEDKISCTEAESTDKDEIGFFFLRTKAAVSHAEENCYAKMLKQGVCAKNGTLFITHSPCINCARLILNSGTKCVYYAVDYKDAHGIYWLRENDVNVYNVNYLGIQ